jgi:hypothetical protein
MLYPTLDSLSVQSLLHKLIAGEEPDIDAVTTWTGSGDRLELHELDQALTRLGVPSLDQADGSKSDATQMEKLEGRLAIAVTEQLCDIPFEVLDDQGFWNYLAVSRFWRFIARREAKAIQKGNGIKYVDAKYRSEQIPLRLFLRGKTVIDRAPDLAWDLERSTDFWRSHVIRVRVGSNPNLATAFATVQKQERMSTNELRRFARRLNRTVTNLAVEVLDAEDATALVEDLRE